MSGKRQKIQDSLASEPTDRGEAPVSVVAREPNYWWRSQHPKTRPRRND
jgi:hypothetical protein